MLPKEVQRIKPYQTLVCGADPVLAPAGPRAQAFPPPRGWSAGAAPPFLPPLSTWEELRVSPWVRHIGEQLWGTFRGHKRLGLESK